MFPISAALAVIRLIRQARIMAVGVLCEIFALGGVIALWVNDTWWLGNATLTLATLGAIIVAGKVAWDYQNRGLNDRQARAVEHLLINSPLTEAERQWVISQITSLIKDSGLSDLQRGTVDELVAANGLTVRQKADLPAALVECNAVLVARAHGAFIEAMQLLNPFIARPTHGDLVVISSSGYGNFQVQHVPPPPIRRDCQVHHADTQPDAVNQNELIIQMGRYRGRWLLFLNPGNQKLQCIDAVNIASPWPWPVVFSLEDCIPKVRESQPDDYLLERSGTDGWQWVRAPLPRPEPL